MLHTLSDEERPTCVLYVRVQLDRDGALLEHSLHLVGALIAELHVGHLRVIIDRFIVVFVVLVESVEIPHQAWEHEARLGVVLDVPVEGGIAELLRIIAAPPADSQIP